MNNKVTQSTRQLIEDCIENKNYDLISDILESPSKPIIFHDYEINTGQVEESDWFKKLSIGPVSLKNEMESCLCLEKNNVILKVINERLKQNEVLDWNKMKKSYPFIFNSYDAYFIKKLDNKIANIINKKDNDNAVFNFLESLYNFSFEKNKSELNVQQDNFYYYQFLSKNNKITLHDYMVNVLIKYCSKEQLENINFFERSLDWFYENNNLNFLDLSVLYANEQAVDYFLEKNMTAQEYNIKELVEHISKYQKLLNTTIDNNLMEANFEINTFYIPIIFLKSTNKKLADYQETSLAILDKIAPKFNMVLKSNEPYDGFNIIHMNNEFIDAKNKQFFRIEANKLFVKYGVNINHVDAFGESPIFALKNKNHNKENAEAVINMIELGADIETVKCKGYSFIEYFNKYPKQFNDSKKIKAFLENYKLKKEISINSKNNISRKKPTL